jgi:hypothetical protein
MTWPDNPTDLDASIRSKPVFEWLVEGMIVMVNQAPPATSRRSRTRLLVQGVLSLVLVVAIFYFLRKKFDPAQMWTAISAMTWLELTLLSLLAVWNLCTYAFVWMAVTPGLAFWRAMMMTQATTAVANTVPGGSAIGIGITSPMTVHLSVARRAWWTTT